MGNAAAHLPGADDADGLDMGQALGGRVVLCHVVQDAFILWRRARPRPHAGRPAVRLQPSSFSSSGIATKRSATRPYSATWKTGPPSSLLMATIPSPSSLPPRCWMAP